MGDGGAALAGFVGVQAALDTPQQRIHENQKTAPSDAGNLRRWIESPAEDHRKTFPQHSKVRQDNQQGCTDIDQSHHWSEHTGYMSNTSDTANNNQCHQCCHDKTINDLLD